MHSELYPSKHTKTTIIDIRTTSGFYRQCCGKFHHSYFFTQKITAICFYFYLHPVDYVE